MPYSDPMMDGVTIQRAGTRALERGVRTRDVFAAVEAVADTGTPAVGDDLLEPDRAATAPTRFARDLADAGGAGAITPDLTPDEAEEWLAGLRRRTSWTGSSWSRRRPPTSGWPAPWPPVEAGSTPPR